MELIQEIGSYAGLAAIPGLAILSALYFSQARDVRRLRDWAGRAPERAAEQAQGGRVAQPAAQPAAAAAAAAPAQPAAQPAAEPATKPAVAAAAAAPAAASAAPAAAATASSSSGGGGGTATATPPRTTTPPRLTPRVPSTAAGQTSILGPAGGPPREPWYRRLGNRLPAARYLAILVVGIAVVGGGIAYGITELTKDDSTGTQQASKRDAGDKGDRRSPAPAVRPEDVTVSVFNGTTVDGLARTVGSDLEQNGFQIGDLVTASEGEVAESVVLFKEGANREAALVAKELDITQIEPADSESIAQAGSAEVIVLAGADLAQRQ